MKGKEVNFVEFKLQHHRSFSYKCYLYLKICNFAARKVITRDCLSNFKAFRTDIPADTYEGCRPAAKDVNLAHYVNNSIKELDIKRYNTVL